MSAVTRRLMGFSRLVGHAPEPPKPAEPRCDPGPGLAERWARRRADTQSRFTQAARLNAMGELAVTLAHELNQPLSAISSYAAAGRRLAESDPELSDLLRKMGDQAARAAEIVAHARDAAQRGEIETAAHALPELIAEAIDLAMPDIVQERVVLRYDFDDDARHVLADRVQVQQVVVNLVRNALEAMAASPWRELRVGANAEGPDLVRVHVIDTGPGVPPTLAERLFEPFVSGKPSGMGVGLSISRGIVEAHGGRLWVERAGGGGAAFYFTLRRAPAARRTRRKTTGRRHATPRLRPAGA